MAGALIARFLPDFDVREHHSIDVNAPVKDAYVAARSLDLARPLPVFVLFALRALPRIVTGRARPTRTVRLEDLVEAGFLILDEDPGREIVLGAIGKFWRPDSGIRVIQPGEFVGFNQPGFAKATVNFAVEPLGENRARISTETRVYCTDERARRNFLRYWSLIRPFSVLIRRILLRAAKQTAEGKPEEGAVSLTGDL